MSIKQGEQLSLFDKPPARDPWRLHPDNWSQGAEDHQVRAWHTSVSSRLPAKEAPGREAHYVGDKRGLHLGTYRAAWERSLETVGGTREWIHPADLDKSGISGIHEPMTDMQANKRDLSTQLVREGGGVAYINDSEDPGSTSYRVHPTAARTWADQVDSDRYAHPALKHLASRGYNMAVHLPSEYARQDAAYEATQAQGTLWSDPKRDADLAWNRPDNLRGEQFAPTLHKTGRRI